MTRSARSLGRLGSGLIACVSAAGWACSGGPAPEPSPGPGLLRGQTVLVLPVQYVSSGSARLAGTAGTGEAARQADAEIAFALSELDARVGWVFPDRQADVLRQRPSVEVDPFALSADEVREGGRGMRRIRDPLYGEIRAMAALFDARFALWPLELSYEEAASGDGRLAIRALLLDARGGDVMWRGTVRGQPHPVHSPAALASAAQAFAEFWTDR